MPISGTDKEKTYIECKQKTKFNPDMHALIFRQMMKIFATYEQRVTLDPTEAKESSTFFMQDQECIRCRYKTYIHITLYIIKNMHKF